MVQALINENIERRDGGIVARTVGIGLQDFGKIRKQGVFLVDKTKFIKDWWETKDDVTLITRPRRFGKTLTLSMVEQFFSVTYAGTDIFQGMNIWQDEHYQELQGTYPVIALSFSSIKETSYLQVKKKICKTIQLLYQKFDFLLKGDFLNQREQEEFLKDFADMEEYEASLLLQQLSGYLSRYYNQKVIILLDEYDTPMQEAYVGGYWKELTAFIKSLFNATFKNNPSMERAIMTGITRVSKESIFSDLNNLLVITTTSEKYSDVFGFTEEEVDEALEEYGLSAHKSEVKRWYDGFKFGARADIYNPWSIIHYLRMQKAGPYWVNTSSNNLVGNLIGQGTRQVKETFEKLLAGDFITTEIDEQIVYEQLDVKESAIWSLLLASGYLKVCNMRVHESSSGKWRQMYDLKITNFEVKVMFENMVQGWFDSSASYYNDFISALLKDDIEAMNIYMNKVALATFSFFDSGNKPSSEREPERFYHGFVLGLMVELEELYGITSNRESGFGRYDVCLEPKDIHNPAMILEFKVQSANEKELTDTAKAALRQIDERGYASSLAAKGFCLEKIRKYGFAFQGKRVLIEGRAGVLECE